MNRYILHLSITLLLSSCGPPKASFETTLLDEPEEISETSATKLKKQEEVQVKETEPAENDPEVIKSVPQKAIDPPSTPPSRKKKKIVFAEMTFDSLIHHLPPITEGDRFTEQFKFVNEGEVPLSIKSADVTCGCTTPEFPFLDIAPGDSGVISVQYYSINKEGRQEAEVTLKANTYPRTTRLKMIFDVMPKVDSSKTTVVKDSMMSGSQ